MNDLQGFLSQWIQNLPQSATALNSSCQILNRHVAWGIRGPVFIWRPTATSEDLTWMAKLFPVVLLGQINTNLNPLNWEGSLSHMYPDFTRFLILLFAKLLKPWVSSLSIEVTKEMHIRQRKNCWKAGAWKGPCWWILFTAFSAVWFHLTEAGNNFWDKDLGLTAVLATHTLHQGTEQRPVEM